MHLTPHASRRRERKRGGMPERARIRKELTIARPRTPSQYRQRLAFSSRVRPCRFHLDPIERIPMCLTPLFDPSVCS